AGMVGNGYQREFAERCFSQIEGFGEYGFPESHAASFAHLVYVSSWIKRHYPDAFCAAILNSQPMGFYAPAQLIRDAREHGVRVLPADVNSSGYDCRLEGSPCALRLGLRLLSGIPTAASAAIEQAREHSPFTSMDDFTHRTGLSPAVVAKLAEADAFGSLALDRRKALWHALSQEKGKKPQPLLAGLCEEEPAAELPPMSLSEQVFADYRTSGLSLKAHR